MGEAPPKTPPAIDWRCLLCTALAIILAQHTVLGIGKALEPSLGCWGAFAIGMVAAGVVAVIVALVVSWMVVTDWRSALTIGLPLGLVPPIADTVREKAIEPTLGYWNALAIGVVAVGVVAGLVALVVSWVIKPGTDDRG